MRNRKSIILLSFISSLFSQPPGEIIDQTMIDIANYWNSSTNQIFIDEANNVFIGYNFSNESSGSNPQVKIMNIQLILKKGSAQRTLFRMANAKVS